MSRYWDDTDDIERRIWRGLVVQRYTGVDALAYIRRQKR